MQYAIELFFDKELEEKLYNLAKRVADEKLSTKFLEWKTRPHITLACFNGVDEEKCIKQLKLFAQTHKQMPAYIGSLGMFNDTKAIFASPIMTEDMYRLQRELHKYMQDFDTTGWEWYLPNRWVPHCTLAMTHEDDEEVFYKASDLLLREFDYGAGKFTSVGLIKITFPVEEIYTVDLMP
ncbi:MAG: 2'-5' RNA ligase family protein [Clostridia bacterium]|nr:2'-5' RNA ligase family protein [Clostridia bacterium]